VPSLAADGAKVGRALIDVLDKEPTTADRRSAAVRVAIEVKLPEEALRVGPKVASALEPAQRRVFLDDVARRAEDQSLPSVALWAYDAERETATNDADKRRLEGRLAASALTLGDTARAIAAEGRLVALLPVGSAERKRILVERIRLEAPRAPADELRQEVEAFRREFPEASEVDELTSAVAMALQAQGRADAAGQVLLNVRGPRSSVERGYLLLQQGNVDSAAVALMESVNDLPPSEATNVIQLVSPLGHVSDAAAKALATAAVLAHRGAGKAGAEGLFAEVNNLPPEDRAPVLAHAARLADDAREPDLAGRIRTQLVSAYADSPEMPEAALALARWLAGSGKKDQAIPLLESLIVKRPNSAVVPAARRELERLKGPVEAARP
jgi:tetratricopeptide (TPR) repeat protein